jgi:hypothetical protein
VEGSGGSRGQASSSASTAYPAGLLGFIGASRQAFTSHSEAQQLGLFAARRCGCGVSPSTEAAAADSPAGMVGFALGSSLESSGSRAASLRWFRRFL